MLPAPGVPRLDVVMSSAATAIVPTNASAFDVSYRILVGSVGTAAASQVQVSDSLATRFAAGSPSITLLGIGVSSGSCTVNPAYNGGSVAGLLAGSDVLEPGSNCTIELRARLAYPSTAAVPASNGGNLVYASSLIGAGPNPGHSFAGASPAAPAGAAAVDVSNSGTSLPALPNGDNPAGTPTPTPLPTLANARGNVFIDANRNGVNDAGEAPRGKYLLQVVLPADPSNPAAGPTLLPHLQAVINADGSYTLPAVPTGMPLALRLVPLAEGSGNTPATAIPAVPTGTTGLPVFAYLPFTIDAATLPANGVATLPNLPIDPSGVVYDSASRQPIAGVVLQLQTAAGTPVPAGTVFGGGPSTVITNADGMYAFFLEASAVPNTYRLAVTPPASHVASVAILPSPTLVVTAGPGQYRVQPQFGAPTGTQDTTYHLEFNFTVARDVVQNHIPLDSKAQVPLFIEKLAEKSVAEIGDSVSYRVRVRNPNAFAVTGLIVSDQLPLGFKLIAGTTRVSVAGVPASSSDPAGLPGPALRFTLGSLAANSEAVLTYRVRIGIGADRGTGVNTAQASGAGLSLSSPVARAVVRVGGGVFSRDACVVGKVYVDCNQSALQDKGEPGIPGVRLVLEDGTSVTSDENGQFSLCGLRAITHVIKVDPSTLPLGARLGLTSSRNAGDADSLFIDLKAGELHRADFRESSCTPSVVRQVEERRRLGPPHLPVKPTGTEDPPGVRFDSDRHRLDRAPAAGGTK